MCICMGAVWLFVDFMKDTERLTHTDSNFEIQ